MKYYEFYEPYFALIKAKNESEAIKIYEKDVADIDSGIDMQEISRDYAIAKFSRSTDEEGQFINIVDLIKIFNSDDESEVLIIDSHLI